MKPKTIDEYLQDQITRCCDLLGHHPDTDKIDEVLKRAYGVQNGKDWTAKWAIGQELGEFK
jgi:hypothetical protein